MDPSRSRCEEKPPDPAYRRPQRSGESSVGCSEIALEPLGNDTGADLEEKVVRPGALVEFCEEGLFWDGAWIFEMSNRDSPPGKCKECEVLSQSRNLNTRARRAEIELDEGSWELVKSP
jgi:hypothetical protein